MWKRDPSPSAAVVGRLAFILALALLSGCFRAPFRNPDEEALADFLGSFSDQNGCKSLMVGVRNPSIRCYEGLYMNIVSGRILVDRDTDCILTSSDVPDWASWGTKYDFEILGSRGERTWIYEPFSKRTFIMEDAHLLRFCPGRVQPPSGASEPCECSPIPAVRVQRLMRQRTLKPTCGAQKMNPADSEGSTGAGTDDLGRAGE